MIILLSTPKQNKELLCTGCTSWASLWLSLCSREQAQGFLSEGRGEDDDEGWQLPAELSSRDAPWWESQLLALAVCPWASHCCDVCVLAYLLQGLKGFIHVPNYSQS